MAIGSVGGERDGIVKVEALDYDEFGEVRVRLHHIGFLVVGHYEMDVVDVGKCVRSYKVCRDGGLLLVGFHATDFRRAATDHKGEVSLRYEPPEII